MKEVLTKSFWQGVKKTFYEAMEPPVKEDAARAPAAGAGDPAPSENPSSPSAPREKQ